MIKLNLARNCLRYLIKAYGIKEIFIPFYSCNTIWAAARKENCNIKFYHIGQDFLPLEEFPKNSFVLYINYFGLCDENCKTLEQTYPNLIIDNTHAFYSKPYGLASFNSLRKFFNVQNGAYLYTDKTLNENFPQDEFLFKPISMQENYEQFVQNEHLLYNQDIKLISSDVEKVINTINFDNDKLKRIEKYLEYHKLFKYTNLIKLPLKKNSVPYCYPLCTRADNILETLVDLKIALLRLWKELPQEFPEYEFLNNTIALPLTDEKLF